MTIVAPLAPLVARPTVLAAPPVAPPAAVAAQATVATVAKTQTAQATVAVGKLDGSRDSQSGTKTGQSLDTAANAFQAQSNRAATRRGSTLDVRV